MSSDVLTRWGLALRLDAPAEAAPGEIPRLLATGDLFAMPHRAYLDRCPVLGAFLCSGSAVVRVAGGNAGEMPDVYVAADGVHLAVSVVEVRPSSFDIAARFGPGGDPTGRSSDGRWTLVLERASTGERLPVPREVRDELIAIQLAARDLC